MQSKEFSDGSGIDLYDAQHRMYDHQTGRFNRVDPLADVFNEETPYNYSYNNPISFNDPHGLSPNAMGSELQNLEIKGWIDPGGGGKVYFDPEVHKQSDIPKGGGTYLGEEIIVTDCDRNPIGFGNDQGTISYNVDLKPATVKGTQKYDSYGKNSFRQTSSFTHWSGTRIDRYVSLLDDGDALRFFSDLKDRKKMATGGDAVSFIPMNYYLAASLGALAILSDKEIDAIIDQYNKTGDKRGIRLQVENVIDASTGNTINYNIYSVKNNENFGQVSQVLFGPAL